MAVDAEGNSGCVGRYPSAVTRPFTHRISQLNVVEEDTPNVDCAEHQKEQERQSERQLDDALTAATIVTTSESRSIPCHCHLTPARHSISTVLEEFNVNGPIPSNCCVMAWNGSCVVTVRVSPVLHAPVQLTATPPVVNPVPTALSTATA